MEEEKVIVENMVALLREKAKKVYSERIVSYGTNPLYRGTMDNPDGYAREEDDEGRSVEMSLRVKDGKVEEVKFMAEGCMFTVAACNAVASMAHGKSLRDCFGINVSSILRHLERLPIDHYHCALLAARLFQKALGHYRGRQKRGIEEGKY